MVKNIRIRDVYDPEKTVALIVSSEEMFVDVLKKFSERPYIRGVFVTNDRGKYMGMIKRDDLLGWAKVKLGDLSGLESYLLRFSKETKAKDVIHEGSEGAVVSKNDDLLKALRLMMSRDLTDIAVLDEKERIVGDITIPELLAKALTVAEG